MFDADEPLRIAAISGSLRDGSYNTATLHAAAELAPDGVDLDVITLEGVEPYNADVEARGWPSGVAALRHRVEPAVAVLFSTPEYNYSVSGVLKNAIDWMSRPHADGVITGKPAGIMGASTSMIGTARAQAHLRQMAYYNAMPLLASNEVLIGSVADKFADDGTLTHEPTREFVKGFMTDFVAWIRTLRAEHTSAASTDHSNH